MNDPTRYFSVTLYGMYAKNAKFGSSQQYTRYVNVDWKCVNGLVLKELQTLASELVLGIIPPRNFVLIHSIEFPNKEEYNRFWGFDTLIYQHNNKRR